MLMTTKYSVPPVSTASAGDVNVRFPLDVSLGLVSRYRRAPGRFASLVDTAWMAASMLLPPSVWMVTEVRL